MLVSDLLGAADFGASAALVDLVTGFITENLGLFAFEHCAEAVEAPEEIA